MLKRASPGVVLLRRTMRGHRGSVPIDSLRDPAARGKRAGGAARSGPRGAALPEKAVPADPRREGSLRLYRSVFRTTERSGGNRKGKDEPGSEARGVP